MQTQEQRIKNNILIAQFMGLDWELFTPSVTVNYLVNGNYYEAHELSYNISWDWLIPVIHKCFEVAEDCEMGDIMRNLQVAEKDDTYTSVIEFIKDYNLKK